MFGGIFLKKTVFILSCFTFFSLGITEVQAEEENLSTNTPKLVYDLEQGGIQSVESISPEGDQLIIEVEKMPNYLRAVKNGTYKISASTSGQWKASYQISVSGNKITKAYSPSIVAYTGSFTKAELKLDSSIQSTYYLKKKGGLFTTSINLRAKLLSNKISITY